MKIEKFTDVCMTGGMHYTPSHIFQFSIYFFSDDITPEMMKLCRVTKVKMFFLVLVYVFNFDLFECSAATLEKGLLIPLHYVPAFSSVALTFVVVDVNRVAFTFTGTKPFLAMSSS